MKPEKICLIIGYGVSGQGVARLLAWQKRVFVVMDDKPSQIDKDEIRWLNENNSSVVSVDDVFGYLNEGKIEFAVVSPGIASDHTIIKMLTSRKIPVYGELAYAVSFLPGLKIGVTGTNGKTSVVHMLYEALKAHGVKVGMAGNMGFCVSDAVLTQADNEVTILEISSFQLEHADRLMLDGAVITNIARDHLERYTDFEDYIKVKASISNRVSPDGFVIYHSDDRNWIKPVLAKDVHAYELGTKEDTTLPCAVEANSLWLKENELWSNILSTDDLNVRGVHMLSNIAMAVSAVSLLGYDTTVSLNVLRGFSGMPHRIEWVACVQGVDYYNDSKATNPNATEKALDSFSTQNIILILGGRDKKVSLEQLRVKIRDTVKTLILIGESTKLYADYFAGIVPMVKATNLHNAVQVSFELAKPHDVVLLSIILKYEEISLKSMLSN